MGLPDPNLSLMLLLLIAMALVERLLLLQELLMLPPQERHGGIEKGDTHVYLKDYLKYGCRKENRLAESR